MAPRGALPRFGNAFVGRDDEVQAVQAAVAEHPLVSLVGPGGSGKSRLAVEAASGRSVVFVELAPVTAGVGAAVLAAVGVEGNGDVGEVIEALHCVAPVLVVLDNCEHLVAEAAAVAAEIVRWTRGVSVLATSREPLGLSDEVLLPMPPLSGEAAACLFLARAAKQATVDEARRVVIDRICARLDRLPLAIELAAALTRSRTVEEIDRSLDDRFAVLVSRDRDRPERHRSLERAIDWGYDLLTTRQRRLLSAFSVFAAPVDRDTISAVTDDVSELDALVARSFVVPRDDGATTRFALLETIRAYAACRLAASDDGPGVAARLAGWALERAQADWPTLDAELPNALAALAAAEGETKLALGCALAPLVLRRPAVAAVRTALGDPPLGHEANRWAGELALVQGDLKAAACHFEAAPASAHREAGLGAVARRSGRFDEAHDRLNRALAEFRAAGDDEGAARCLLEMSRAAGLRGDAVLATSLAEESRRIRTAGRDEPGVLECLAVMGKIAEATGDFGGARQAYNEAIAAGRRSGDVRTVAATLAQLGDVAFREEGGVGDFVEARARYEDSLRLYRELADRRGEARCVTGLATIAYRTNDLARAIVLYGDGVQTLRMIGDRRGLVRGLTSLGNALAIAGDAPAGRPLLDEALGLARELDDARELIRALTAASEVARDGDEFLSARTFADEALALAERIGDERWALHARFQGVATDAALADRVAVMGRAPGCLVDAMALGERHLAARLLEAVGGVVCEDDPAAAARLFGAAEFYRAVPPFTANVRAPSRWRYDRAVATCRQALAEDFERVWLEGRAAGQDVTLALVRVLADPSSADGSAGSGADRAATPTIGVWRRTEHGWLIGVGGCVRQVSDGKGMGYIARLLAVPRLPVSVLDLAAATAVAEPGLPRLDQTALRAYRSRLTDLRQDIDHARSWNDQATTLALEAEADALVAELSSSLAVGGRIRGDGATTDRARKAVTKCIREAIAKVGAVDGDLGRHLGHAIKTGYACTYDPEWDVVWTL